ncbi:hypothetical protein G7075_19215 [Phycicoccus sp. HDW14]|uniref:sensor histidine kinase n=1 Tax=Phycicoccus sp. HDW14 TaxID=2714941 RepID=UPI00140C0F05|nr:histidine kinase [Phycicoccus sp. HDW14]QIM22774.1 hypothetical protein G7075_19215 [Phycicoccus sp. HDW14]
MTGLSRPQLEVLGAGVIVVAKVAASVPQLHADLAAVAITWLVTVAFVGVGLALLRTDLAPVNGRACLLVAASTVPGDLNSPFVASGPWVTAGYVLEPTYVASAVALVLRYPRSRLSPGEAWTVWTMFGTAVLGRLGAALTDGPASDDFFRPPGQGGSWSPWLHDVLFVLVGRGLTATMLGVVVVLLTLRLRRAHGLSREAQFPLTAIGTICAAAAAVDQLVWAIGPDKFDVPAALVRNVAAALLPFALLSDLTRRRAAEATVSRQVLQAAMTGDLQQLQAAIRGVILDPRARVVLPDGDGRWVDGSGAPVGESDLPPRARVLPLRADGASEEAAPVLVFDRTCCGDEGLLGTIVSAADAGLQNTRLHTDLLEALAEVQRSRHRIVQAAADERRKVERDLHDGAQQQFLAVAATLARAEYVHADAVRDVVSEAKAALTDALRELRELARGIHPPLLTELGLGAALTALARRSALAVAVDVDDLPDALPDDAAAAVYFFVAEALTNVVRHAGASCVEVRVRCADGVLTASVGDDGTGGAAPRPGGGLAGLADRFDAMGGSVDVLDHPGRGGSTLLATLPLGRPP